ncbi:MAG TPA: GNAT family N-acetyltransferase [Nocardioides sp.]|jgi:GNAT superfamily N-acetyltransferase|nr:GNAT family N-acetyltransferase [Nocardioides sp.]
MSAERAMTRAVAPRVATPDDALVVTRILVDAFHADPMWGPWAFPDPTTRRQGRNTVFGLLVEGALRYPWVWLSAGKAAAAVWIPPGGSELSPAQEEQINAVLHESLGARTASVLEAFERFAEARPTEPHYYLTLLGTDPTYSGRGIGQRLLSTNLERVDEAGVPAYLEASDELVPLYARHGFRVLRRFALDDGPTVNGMWREPGAPAPE